MGISSVLWRTFVLLDARTHQGRAGDVVEGEDGVVAHIGDDVVVYLLHVVEALLYTTFLGATALWTFFTELWLRAQTPGLGLLIENKKSFLPWGIASCRTAALP